MHVHFLVKGLDPSACEAAEALLGRVWAKRTGAHVVEVRELRSAGGATAYLALHHRKRSQGPPAGYRGFRRLRSSQGYFGGGGRERRQEAREVLADKRFQAAIRRHLEERFVEAGAATRELVEHDGQLREVFALDDAASEAWDELLETELDEALERREYERPVLVRVRQRDVVDEATGEISRELVEVGERVYRAKR